MIFDIQKEKQNLNQAIQDAYNSTLKFNSDKNREALQKEYFKRDIANKEILQKYDKEDKITSSFQSQLKNAVVTMTEDELIALYNKDIAIKKEKKLEEQNKIQKQNLKEQDIALDSEDEKQIENKINEQQGNEKDVDRNNIALRFMYEKYMEEYHTLVERIQQGKDGQLKTGNLAIDNTKLEVELVSCQTMLRKIDSAYRVKNHCYIVQDDKDIQQKEDKYLRNEAKNKQEIYNRADNHMQQINELNQQIDGLADEMVTLSTSDMLSSEKQKRLDGYQEEYLQKTAELATLNPSVSEYHRQVHELEEQDDYEYRRNGNVYEDKKRKIGDTKTNSINKTKEEVPKQMEDTLHKLGDISNKQISDVIKEYQEERTKENPNMNKLKELVQTAEMLTMDNRTVGDIEMQEEQPVIENEEDNSFIGNLKENVKENTEVGNLDIMDAKMNDIEERINGKEKNEDKDINIEEQNKDDMVR